MAAKSRILGGRLVAIGVILFGFASFSAEAAVSLTKGTIFNRDSNAIYPDPLSGITYAGGSSYYAVADNGVACGLYPCTITLGSDGKTVSSFAIATTNNVVRLSGTSDLEGVAYDPATGNVWAADESKKTIKEYDPATGAVVQSLTIPPIMTKNASNFGFESLTISGDGLTLWTANEEALTVDGSLSSYADGTVVRLVKYTRATINDKFELAAMYPYKTEKWTCQYDYSNKARCGVADLCALPDGSLLVLERELSFSSTSGFSIFLGASVLGWKVYHIADPTQATDVKDYPSLQDGVWAKEIKTLLASDSDDLTSYGNFEGICLGPRLSNGNLSVLLISDSGDGWSQRRLFPLVLSGLNVRTLNFEEPAGYTASVKGSNYRYLDGAPVSVALSGPGVLNSAYTNNGETVATALWAAPGQSPSAGNGPLAAFTVAGDGTVTWAVATGTAVSAVVGHDSFEAYAGGTLGSAIPGWSGEEAEVVELSYSAAAGYPMDREAHTKVLSVDGDLTRTYSTSETNANQKLEMMVAVHRAPAGEPLSEPDSDCKIILVCDENGRVCLKCVKPDGTQGWVALSSTPYANDDWVRVSFLFDYASNGDGRAFVQVSLDGTPCVTADGVASPAAPTAGGDWYELLTVGQKRLSSVTASGMCKLDDLIYTIEAVAPEFIDGVPVSWLDATGLGRDPSVRLTGAKLAALGYTLGDAFDAGLNPQDDVPFLLTDIRLRADRRLQLTFNGVRNDKPLSEIYHVYFRETPGGEPSEVAGTAVAGEGQTVWTSMAPVGTVRGFYHVEASR